MDSLTSGIRVIRTVLMMTPAAEDPVRVHLLPAPQQNLKAEQAAPRQTTWNSRQMTNRPGIRFE